MDGFENPQRILAEESENWRRLRNGSRPGPANAIYRRRESIRAAQIKTAASYLRHLDQKLGAGGGGGAGGGAVINSSPINPKLRLNEPQVALKPLN